MIIMKKIKIISIFIMFALSFLSHFAYETIPNFLSSILFPVNESIWEHMKLLSTPVLLYMIIEYFIFKKKKIETNNFILSYSLSIISSIIIFLIIYVPIYNKIGNSMFIDITLLIIIFIYIAFLTYKLFNIKKIKYSNLLGIILFIIIYFNFFYLTYYPIKDYLFLDTTKNIYGIPK